MKYSLPLLLLTATQFDAYVLSFQNFFSFYVFYFRISGGTYSVAFGEDNPYSYRGFSMTTVHNWGELAGGKCDWKKIVTLRNEHFLYCRRMENYL